MERDKPEDDATAAQSDEEVLDAAIDHQRLARLVERSEPDEVTSTFGTALSIPRLAEPRHTKSSPVIILVIAVVGIVIVVAAGLWFISKDARPRRGREESTQAPRDSSDDTSNPGGDNSPITGVKQEPIEVPGGTFQMGRTGGPQQEAPPHAVTVQSFAMDKTEVTNAEYADFVRETNRTPPSHWSGNSPIVGQEQLPVANVSLEDAKEFAKWRSNRDKVTYRLPTEEEWEYAARGGDQGYLYPWGNSWIGDRTATKGSGLIMPKPVGSYPDGKARWGHLDLIGNVWEWTSSKPTYYSGSDVTVLPEHRDWAIIRGGSIASDPLGDKAISNAYRDWIEPTTKNPMLGFRLVREGAK